MLFASRAKVGTCCPSTVHVLRALARFSKSHFSCSLPSIVRPGSIASAQAGFEPPPQACFERYWRVSSTLKSISLPNCSRRYKPHVLPVGNVAARSGIVS